MGMQMESALAVLLCSARGCVCLHICVIVDARAVGMKLYSIRPVTSHSLQEPSRSSTRLIQYNVEKRGRLGTATLFHRAKLQPPAEDPLAESECELMAVAAQTSWDASRIL